MNNIRRETPPPPPVATTKSSPLFFMRHHKVLLPLILLLTFKLDIIAQSTSINYGISHQPITDVSQLMPSLCQNQSVICEGSFCIPGVKKCVCDLRQPVQLGRFCLRQIDIETKCFATIQCNHTIKDAVCTDINSNTILDAESSRFKLEQWQQLNALRQASQSAVATQDGPKNRQTASSAVSSMKAMFLTDNTLGEPVFQVRDDVIMSNVRNSPYEINYYTPELLQQNHTRRKNENNDKNMNLGAGASTSDTQNDGSRPAANENSARSSSNLFRQSIVSIDTTTQQIATIDSADLRDKSLTTTTETSVNLPPSSSSPSLSNAINKAHSPTSSTTPTSSLSNELSKKKMVVKAPNWPPGICSCPPGYMFDSMLRKCLALSLIDSHCMNDNDCKQIRLTHCSRETKKCDCDEPLVWNMTELACVRPKPKMAPIPERPAAPLLLSELLPDQTMILFIFVIAIIVATLLILGLIVKCCSSNKPALISPKNHKNKKSNQNSLPRSPYATLHKTEKTSSQLNSYTQATRGRILNYDFEQDNPIQESSSSRPASVMDHREQQQSHEHATIERGGTLAKLKGLKQNLKSAAASSPDATNASLHAKITSETVADDPLDLNELDSETKSEHSILAPPQPTTNQPTYMLAGQQSAIAAAAAAVANRRNFGKPEFV